jgi:hypothetical protein
MSQSPLARAVALAALGSCLTLPSLAQAEFIKDSKATIEARNFYFNRDFRQDGGSLASGQSKQDEWAQGFILRLDSGFTEGTVGFGADAIGTFGFKLDSGDGTSGSGLLVPDKSGGSQDNHSDLAFAAKVKVSRARCA